MYLFSYSLILSLRKPVGDSRPACFLHRCVISARIAEGLKAGLAPPVGRCDARAVGIRPGLRGVRPVSSDRGKDAMLGQPSPVAFFSLCGKLGFFL